MKTNQIENEHDALVMALSVGGINVRFDPAQVQKAMFRIVEEAATIKSGGFNFLPYNYGPFDQEIFSILSELEKDKLVDIIVAERDYQYYRITESGMKKGKKLLNQLAIESKQKIEEIVRWALDSDLRELVRFIYKKYPDMKRSSIFCG